MRIYGSVKFLVKLDLFVDTNVLVYACDHSEPGKQRPALEILDHLVATQAGVISTQILAEFFVTVTRKIAASLNVEAGYQRLANYWQA